MAIDQAEVADQEVPSTEETPLGEVAAEEAAPSAADREQGRPGWFQRLFGRRDAELAPEPVSDDGEPEEPADEVATPDAGLGRAEEIRREAQRLADREIAKREWTRALTSADRGDTAALREMAERGHGPAQHELAKRGETYELGEARAKELARQQEQESLGESLQAIAQTFDTATIAPILSVLPEAAKKSAHVAFTKAGGGMDGREALVTAALKAYASSIREASDDDVLARIDTDPIFRKKVMARVRGAPEYDEAESVAAVSGTAAADGGDAFVRSLFARSGS